MAQILVIKLNSDTTIYVLQSTYILSNVIKKFYCLFLIYSVHTFFYYLNKEFCKAQ